MKELQRFYEVKISAENQDQADTILNSLLNKKLVTGGQFFKMPGRFLWKGKIQEMPEYITITSYTIEKHKQSIIKDVNKTSIEEVPMITFVVPDHLNPVLADWIENTVK